MKLKLLLSLFCVTCIGISAETLTKCLIIKVKDGTTHAYVLSEKPKITFSETDLIVNSGKTEVSFALDNMEEFTYEDVANTGIANIEEGKKQLDIVDGDLYFSGLKPNSMISVYNVEGSLVVKKELQGGGNCILSLSELTSGVYLVNVNGLTTKIIKK